MKKFLHVMVIYSFLSGCMMTNHALNVDAKPTDMDGYWSANGGGHVINWFIRPDGTGVHCEVNSMSLSGSPLVLELKIVDKTAYLNNTYILSRSDNDNFEAATWGGAFSLNFKRAKHAPAACKQYFDSLKK